MVESKEKVKATGLRMVIRKTIILHQRMLDNQWVASHRRLGLGRGGTVGDSENDNMMIREGEFLS